MILLYGEDGGEAEIQVSERIYGAGLWRTERGGLAGMNVKSSVAGVCENVKHEGGKWLK